MERTNSHAAVRRPQQRGDSRAAILGAAEQIFAKSGLAGARTDAIADAAGVNKALLYYYFKSKGGLYEAVVEDHFREFNRQALDVLAAPASARAVLLRYVSLYFDFISARQRYAALYQQLMTARGKSLERLVRKYMVPRSDAFNALLKRGIRDGELRRVDPRHTAISIVGVVIFAGLTAWDTQRIKLMYLQEDDEAVAGKKAVLGALTLYLDALNLFLMLMQVMGRRRD